MDASSGKLQVTLLVALGTLCFQIFQFGYSAHQKRISDEDAQWRAAVKTLSLTDGTKSFNGALNVKTFFNTRYESDAIKLVAASIPHFSDADAHDLIFYSLREALPTADGSFLYEVNRSVAMQYSNDIDCVNQKYPRAEWRDSRGEFHKLELNKPAKFEYTLSSVLTNALDAKPRSKNQTPETIDEIGCGTKAKLMEDALLREWEIDTEGSMIIQFWRNHGRSIAGRGKEPPSINLDLRGTIFRADENKLVDMKELDLDQASFVSAYLGNVDLTGSTLRGANLSGIDLSHSNLTAAHLEKADLAGADLSHSILTAAKFVGANLDQTILTSVDKEQIQIIVNNGVCNAKTALLPSGIIPSSSGPPNCPEPINTQSIKR